MVEKYPYPNAQFIALSPSLVNRLQLFCEKERIVVELEKFSDAGLSDPVIEMTW